MKQRFILALLILVTLFASCSDDEEVVPAPVISGIENTYTVIEGAKLELNPLIENGANATYLWQLNGIDVSKTQGYLFEESTPGDYKLVLKVENKRGVDEMPISIVVVAKDFTIEAVAYKLVSLEVPDYMKNSGELEWEVVNAPSELYRLSQVNAEETPIFVAAEEGTYLLQVRSSDINGEVTINVSKNENELSSYIANVFNYKPAPGQFVNEHPKYKEGDTHEDMVAKVGERIVGENSGFITLGGWGGYVTFGFDHTIVNVAGKQDLRIGGNGFTDSSEPGIVMVSYDANGNGKADDEWYEIAGSGSFTAENEAWYQDAMDKENDVATYRNYEMTYYRPEVETNDVLKEYIRWTNNIGDEDEKRYKEKNSFHRQSYYPLWVSENELTFSGVRLAQNGVKNMLVQLKSFKYGYVDNHSSTDNKSTIDIDWAIDKDGNKANLPGIDFVKVYTGVDQENAITGENSTEVSNASDLHMIGEDIDSIKE